MKKKLISFLVAFVFMLNLAVPVLADTTSTTPATTSGGVSSQLPDPGILPDSPFYFLDKLFEQIQLIFIFSPEKKAEVLLEDANERLSESNALIDEGKQELATKTAQAYVNTIEAAQVQVIIAVNDGKVSGTVYDSVYTIVNGQKSQNVVAVVYGLDLSERNAAKVLLRVLAKAPEQARKGLLNAFENVIKHEVEENSNILITIDGKTVSLAVYGDSRPEKHNGGKNKSKIEEIKDGVNEKDGDNKKDEVTNKDGVNEKDGDNNKDKDKQVQTKGVESDQQGQVRERTKDKNKNQEGVNIKGEKDSGSEQQKHSAVKSENKNENND